jgi:hypothetical protein
MSIIACRAQSGRGRTLRYLIAGLFLVLAPACSDPETPTSPTETTATTTQTVAEPSVTEEFTGVLPTGGSAFYSFSVGVYGTVNVTFSSISGAGVPATAWMALGIGVPSGEDCATTSVINGPTSSTPQFTTTSNAGVYCVRIQDLGNLFAPARFTIAIAHP